MQLAPPSLSSYPESGSGLAYELGSAPKFPHTRAQLSAIARQHKPSESYDSDAETEDYNRVPSSLVNKVVSCLVDDNEDELKKVLKQTFEMDNETVRMFPAWRPALY